ncbi:predicted protein [Uncinocarpus reesii 1704]|uniref:ATP-grasp enzyme uncJ n=1 Tax=Uncinocarpus reesii (strain UAMH 1704) TaxID=336963 RepID=UNCJ_UNCRE|nr:uncharacterized protein UREG_02303 [Uncinocarpus reesii 1704]EEP77454.1 predicted protein [Uncinocarpus reesii 1704]
MPQRKWAMVDSLYSPEGGSQEAASFLFRWRVNPHHESFVARTVDLVIQPFAINAQAGSLAEFTWPENLREGLGTHTRTVQEFVNNALKKKGAFTPVGIKLILPAQNGFVARSDIIELRMHGCDCATAASGFMQPRQYIDRFQIQKPRHELSQLSDILSACIGAVSVNESSFESIDYAMQALEDQVRHRLALEFLLPNAIPHKRVALVHCPRELLTYEAIRCLGLDLVVLDRPGHFLEDPNGPFAYLRESFHPIDLNVDDGLPQRIVDVVRNLKLDGIFTRYDFYSRQVAKAAELLGLPTSPYSAYCIATDKYATRMLDAEESGAFCVKDDDELEQRLRDPEKPLNIQYPVVVKPCLGWSSLTVTKARDEGELVAAVRKAHSRVLGHEGERPIQPRVLVEPYVDGPEVDVNFAMWDGEVVFSDISDDFPCLGDMDDKTGVTDFQDTIYLHPSKLPKMEQDLLRQRLKDCVLRMGFRTGVVHCEARMRNSAMKYVEKDGIFDLASDSQPRGTEPSIFMIEVNPRPPGYFALHGSTWTHGVDYYLLHVLCCVQDEQRFKALAVPFSREVQHSIAVLNLPTQKGGILRSLDPAIRLAKEKPGLRDAISLYHNYFEPGEYVTPPDAVETKPLAVVVVESQTGREDLLRRVEEVRDEWTPVVD